MTGLLICAAVVASGALCAACACGMAIEQDHEPKTMGCAALGLALIAAALYIAWRAGGAV